jgi:hypothetical protein
MVGGKVHHSGDHGFDVGQIVHVNAPTCRFLSSVAELAPTASAFVMRGEPGADVRFDPVSFVVGFDAEQQRKQHGKKHRKRSAGEHQVATEVLRVLDQRSRECPRCAICGDEHGAAKDVTKPLALSLRHDLDGRAPSHGPSGEN